MWRIFGVWLLTLAGTLAGPFAGKEHPRLWLPESGEARVRETLDSDPLAAGLQALAIGEAERILKERTCRFEIPDGLRLLAESRRALHNVMHSAWAWRITGEDRFRRRAVDELEAACAMENWNPRHFLDVAEMATAVATGYDWLYDTLTPGQREMCEKALVEKALKPAKEVYDKGNWWSKPGNNWSQVCGSGIALAAAAIDGRDEGLAGNLFQRGLDLVGNCSRFYEPDGMYPEGPAYWHYGSDYHVMLLGACGPLGQKYHDDPILRKAGDSIMHLTSNTRLNYNFADGNASREVPSPAQCWLASRYGDGAQAAHVRRLFARALEEGGGKFRPDRCFPLSILWLPPASLASADPAGAAVFHGEQSMALFRTGWNGKDPWFAIKGGTPAASHGHMDAGSFCYDAHGERWIHDLGSDNYNLPSYFSGKRWTYYRLQNRSHNTLEIGGKLQNAKAKPCPVIGSSLEGDSFMVSFDLSDAYAGSADKVVRSATFDRKTGVVRIEDRIESPVGEVVWRAFADVPPVMDGDSVTISRPGRGITLRDLSGAGVWSVAEATPPTAGENQNKNYRAVVLTVPKADRVNIAVEIRPWSKPR
ncbi:heparinase II/III domain-containing protein [Luteolibacter marinus]|uniref:heparinase II/III domain-containing protein n=1 Tax=Luteolibacter marinus TaxID=2776705 RepID=UPI0018679A67|nr:heparinase II/III family protein [Luteolibacter marinus]